MKKKIIMHNTFKTAIFGNASDKENAQPQIVKIINNRLVINNDFCDLRTIKERFNPETKVSVKLWRTFTPSLFYVILIKNRKSGGKSNDSNNRV